MAIPRVISKLFYAVLLSSLNSSPPSSATVPLSPAPTRSRFNRAVSFVHLVDRMVPGVARRLSRRIYINSQVPWPPVQTELIARGSGSAVFKLNLSNGEKVLRIYRRSLGESLDGLLKVATYYKNRYETVLTWYGASPGLVPHTDFLVLQGPPLVGPVAASLQSYIHGQKRDFFQDFSDDELLALFSRDSFVRKQFLFFARETFRQWDEGTVCFDFLGRQNLMLVNQGERYRLCIADIGFFTFETIAEKYPWKLPRIEKRINKLSRLYDLAKGMEDG